MTSLYRRCAIVFITIIIIIIASPLLVSAARTLRGSVHRRGAQEGATWREAPGIAEVRRYLHRFGYLGSGNFTDLFDDSLESALARYQSRLGLPVTGALDATTVAALATPRCGVRDGGGGGGGAEKFAFFAGRPSWDRPRPFTLTYAFSAAHGDARLDAAGVRAAFERAFARWAAVIPVRFEEAQEYAAADVRIGFYEGAHGDGEPFDGVLGILAHAFSPESGRLHLDAAETWALDFQDEPSPLAVDLESVATHEIGHVLGLGHSSVKEAVMYPSLSPRTRKVNLRLDDVEGAQALYGSNPSFRFSSLAQSDTSAAEPPRLSCGHRLAAAAIAAAAFL